MYTSLLANIAILVLSGFVGFAVISKVPNTLHTPLMSGTNAIHGIVVLGALVVLGKVHDPSIGLQIILFVALVFGNRERCRWFCRHGPHVGDVQGQAGRQVCVEGW